jgi:hypothetical protein
LNIESNKQANKQLMFEHQKQYTSEHATGRVFEHRKRCTREQTIAQTTKGGLVTILRNGRKVHPGTDLEDHSRLGEQVSWTDDVVVDWFGQAGISGLPR